MERIAIISDIHGNVPALEAVLKDIRQRDIGRIFCLGDLVGKGPHPDRTVDTIRGSCEAVVQGNWDEFITEQTEKPELRWHRNRLGEERLSYLKGLPFSLEFWCSGKFIRLFHASPESVYKRVQPWHPLELRLSMFDNTEQTGTPAHGARPHVVGYGDVHNAYVQHFPGKMLFNAGSVGNPLDITQASYAIIEGDYGSQEAGPFGLTLARVPYDIEAAIRMAAAEKMPYLNEYAKELRTGRYRGLPD
ncbi:metallophosphoesterase family protein [Paenibacillus alkalitolerans]|uniref:metallophosphoesterase family protein n=1 Tax=Paenibacillus alkalitolerans TaxID=2799335 RepID=UPI0018F5E3A7|nr:metallophosphoesterase family protein [Paenibacillus alkalitolerans]